MITDTEIKVKGLRALSNALGEVEAERFISLILKEPFDYSQWQKDLFAGQSVKEISAAATKYREATEKNKKL
ncbi:MAG: hypothetical protein MK080_06245 [Opitutales bacterium]|nr:hypothetical protein [Opitutales bacterium]NRA27279.1 hypothetical protein [Opitutales bacterium]